MPRGSIEQRVTNLEVEVARLKRRHGSEPTRPWWERIAGAFANDPAFNEAMRLGREYRRSLRPARGRTGKGANGHP